jgi:mannosyltransferase
MDPPVQEMVVVNQKSLRSTKVLSLTFIDQRVLESALLFSITLVALFLRIYKLGEWSFWGDEVFSIGTKEDGFNYSIWRRSLAVDLIHVATAALGTTEWSARLVPALIGIISIPVLYFLIRKAFGTPAALAASALLAVSPWHLYWSQNARFYSLLLLFYSLALLTFYLGIENDRPLLLVLSLLFIGLGARERLVALFFIPTILSYLLLLLFLPFERPAGFRSRNFLLIFSPVAVLGLILAGPYLLNFKDMLVGFGRTNNNPFWILSGVVYYIGIPIVSLAAFGAFYFLLRRSRAALFFVLGAGIPLIGIMIASLFVYSANRYVFVSLTSWLILAGMAVAELFTRLKQDGRLLALGVMAVLLLTSAGEVFLYHQYQNGNRPDWKAAFEFIQKHRQPGDVITTSDRAIGEYYLQDRPMPFKWFEPGQDLAFTNRVWIVEDMVFAEIYPQKARWVEEHTRLMANFDVIVHARNFKMRVYLLDPQPENRSPEIISED